MLLFDDVDEQSVAIAIEGLEDKVPDEWKFSVYGKLLGHADIDKQPRQLKLAGEIYKRK